MRKIKNIWVLSLTLTAIMVTACIDPYFTGGDNDHDNDNNQVETLPLELPTEAFEGYQLSWNDEFNENQLNESSWNYRLGNMRESYGTEEAVTVSGGSLVINGTQKEVGGKSYEGGGIITKEQFQYGYFEVRAKMSGEHGWHESFWSTMAADPNNLPPGYSNTPRVEFDAFEHYATHATNTFSYGMIRWYPDKKSLVRSSITESDLDVSSTYNTWGWEFTPDYFNFYFNREVIQTVPVTEFAHHDYHLYLSMIATLPDAHETAEIRFDYFRHYTIDFESEVYASRKAKYTNGLVPTPSTANLWIEPENFKTKGGWQYETWSSANPPTSAQLRGHTSHIEDRPSEELSAFSYIEIPNDGTYKLWVRSYTQGNGSDRSFGASINNVPSGTAFQLAKASESRGWHWEQGGTFELVEGDTIKVELVDLSQFWARADKILLTTDLEFTPTDAGEPENVIHYAE